MISNNTRQSMHPRYMMPMYSIPKGQVCPLPAKHLQPMVMDRSLAMVYPEWQEFRDLYQPDVALCRGTLFQELDKPFCY